MESNILTIKIPEDIRNNLQRADLECNSRYNILTYILSNNLKIMQERIDKYQKDYDEKLLFFEQLKNQLENDYIIPIIPKNYIVNNWHLNYSTSTITVQIIEEH